MVLKIRDTTWYKLRRQVLILKLTVKEINANQTNGIALASNSITLEPSEVSVDI